MRDFLLLLIGNLGGFYVGWMAHKDYLTWVRRKAEGKAK